MSGGFAPRMTARAQRQLRRELSVQAALVVLAHVKQVLGADPRDGGTPLVGPEDGLWRADLGVAVVYYEIREHEVVVTEVQPPEGATPAR